jgi:ATP-dependent Clp protease protease subunit
MPIGIPKVAYRIPGEAVSTYVDVYNRLYRERILFLGEDLDDEVANQLIGVMVFLNSEDDTKGIFFYINSPGGSMNSGLGVYDMIQHINVDVTTICMGLAASMASFILAGGTPGQRLMFPHARVMLHQPMGGNGGKAKYMVEESVEVKRLRELIAHLYAKRTNQPVDRIRVDMNRDNFMRPRAAKEYGLIDHMITHITELDEIEKDSSDLRRFGGVDLSKLNKENI